MTSEMKEWAYYAMDAVHALAGEDQWYQELNEKRLALQGEYEQLLESLSPEQRELITSYQCYCEEMQFQKIRLAYFLGKKHPGEFIKK